MEIWLSPRTTNISFMYIPPTLPINGSAKTHTTNVSLLCGRMVYASVPKNLSIIFSIRIVVIALLIHPLMTSFLVCARYFRYLTSKFITYSRIFWGEKKSKPWSLLSARSIEELTTRIIRTPEPRDEFHGEPIQTSLPSWMTMLNRIGVFVFASECLCVCVCSCRNLSLLFKYD